MWSRINKEMGPFPHSDFGVLDITQKDDDKGSRLQGKNGKTNLFYVGVTFGKEYKSIYVFGLKYETSESTKPDFRSLCWLVRKNFFFFEKEEN